MPHIHQWNGSALVRVMACRLCGSKTLPEIMPTHYQLDPEEQTWNWNQNITVSFTKMHLEMCVCEMVAILSLRIRVNSSPPSAAYIRQWIGSEMVQIMACRLFGTKPLSKPMLSCCWLGPWAPTSMKFQSKYKTFHSRKKNIKKCRLRNGGYFVQGEMS